MRIVKKNNLSLYEFESPTDLPVTTFVTTRENSDDTTSPRGNFNLGLYCGDDTTIVEQNLNKLCDSLDISRKQLFYPHQIHGTEIQKIDNTFLALPHEEQISRLDGVDALITDVPNIAITVTTADCVPILLYDTAQKVSATIHAGWRGTAKAITRHVLTAMQTHYGSQPQDIYAMIAPCIGIDAYEVGDEVTTALQSAGYDLSYITKKHPVTGRTHIDLATANAYLLLQQGILLEHLEVCGICTHKYSNTFYSVRALGKETGRFLTGIIIR